MNKIDDERFKRILLEQIPAKITAQDLRFISKMRSKVIFSVIIFGLSQTKSRL